MGIQLTTSLVLEGGKIDQDKSEAAFRGALLKYVAERETEGTLIEEAVDALFTQYKSASINMPAVCSMAAQRLGAQPENFKVLSDRVAEYIRANSQETGSEKDGNLVQHPDSKFVIAKGKGGGVYVRADRPAKSDEQK